MRKVLSSIFLFCGVVILLAAPPVSGQVQDFDIAVSKKPLNDLVKSVKGKNIDWSKPFAVELETVLTKDGRFDREKTKFTKTEGKADSVEIVKQAFEAVGDSGWLAYLRNMGIDQVKFSVVQDSETFTATLFSEQQTPERAKTIASSFNGLVAAVAYADRSGYVKLGEDEKKLLSGAKVNAQEKTANISVSLGAKDFQDMIRRRLGEPAKKTTK